MLLGFRYRNALYRGVRLNVGKRGVSVSLGVPGATINLGRRGARYCTP